MYEPAVASGIPADKYWSMTYEEIIVQATANKKRKQEELKEKAVFDYKMAQLSSYAMNAPSKMPSFNKAYPNMTEESRTSDSEQQDWREMQANLLNRGAEIEETRKRKNKS